MDSLLTSAARLLAAGDPLAALKRVALREDAPALAMRGIAMAQLGEYQRARELLRRAARHFGNREKLSRARCHVAEAEVALAARELSRATSGLQSAAAILTAHGDHANALHAHLVEARFHLLVGAIAAADRTLSAVTDKNAALPSPLLARAELTRAEIALRHLNAGAAAAAIDRARTAAISSGIPALRAEVGRVHAALSAPSARLIRAGEVRPLRLNEVEAVLRSGDLIVDGCRREIRASRGVVRLAARPVLFELARALAEVWPKDFPRDELITRAFAVRVAQRSDRARLRVEISRLRAVLRPVARIESTASGFVLQPVQAPAVAVLAPPNDGPAGAILALLEDGASWSTSALATALGSSQRTVQRTLSQLAESAAVRFVGQGRSRRWLAPSLGGFATTLLLPVFPPLR